MLHTEISLSGHAIQAGRRCQMRGLLKSRSVRCTMQDMHASWGCIPSNCGESMDWCVDMQQRCNAGCSS